MGNGSCTRETGILKETILEDITDYRDKTKEDIDTRETE